MFIEEFESLFMAPWGVKMNNSLLSTIISEVHYCRMIFLWVYSLFLGFQECGHVIWFRSREKTVADRISKKRKTVIFLKSKSPSWVSVTMSKSVINPIWHTWICHWKAIKWVEYHLDKKRCTYLLVDKTVTQNDINYF